MRDWVGLWRKDRRCGPEFPLPDNSGPTQCNPDSEDKFCCSKWDNKYIISSHFLSFFPRWGFCGGDGEHCDCPECINYRENK